MGEEDGEDEDLAFLPVRRPWGGRAPGKHFTHRKRKARSPSSVTCERGGRDAADCPIVSSHRRDADARCFRRELLWV